MSKLKAILLIALGSAIQVYSGWSIDFAFIHSDKGLGELVVPLIGWVNVGEWWNLHFIFLYIGSLLMMTGAYFIGKGEIGK